MKVLPIGKGYVTLYFFAIMIHCSPPFCYESGIMQHYAYVHPMWFLCFSAGGLPAGVNIIWLLEVSCGFLYSFLFVLNWGCSARPRLTDIRTRYDYMIVYLYIEGYGTLLCPVLSAFVWSLVQYYYYKSRFWRRELRKTDKRKKLVCLLSYLPLIIPTPLITERSYFIVILA